MERRAERHRKTKETDVGVRVDLDGKGEASVATGIDYLDHMLETLAFHGEIDIEIKAKGDLSHHVAEDVAITLGEAIDEALGDRIGVKRFGYATVAMEDAMVLASIDLAKRPYANIRLGLEGMVEGMATEEINHFLRTLAISIKATLHLMALAGEDKHHITEAAFKSLAHSLAEALSPGKFTGSKSLKGAL